MQIFLPSFNKLKSSVLGFTLVEMLVVVALLSILSTASVVGYKAQLDKTHDTRKKSDFSKIRVALEDYYNDNNCYPNSLPECNQPLDQYLSQTPCDPANRPYEYITDESGCSQSYYLFTTLKNSSDPQIADAGCAGGCSPEVGTTYNYGVSSDNVSIADFAVSPSPSVTASLEPSIEPSLEPSILPCPGGIYSACSGDTCGFYDPQSNSCSVYFCGTSCDGGCTVSHVIIPGKQCNP